MQLRQKCCFVADDQQIIHKGIVKPTRATEILESNSVGSLLGRVQLLSVSYRPVCVPKLTRRAAIATSTAERYSP